LTTEDGKGSPRSRTRGRVWFEIESGNESLRENENRDEINRGRTGHEAAVRKIEVSIRRSRVKTRGTRMQDQRVGPKIACLLAKAGGVFIWRVQNERHKLCYGPREGGKGIEKMGDLAGNRPMRRRRERKVSVQSRSRKCIVS